MANDHIADDRKKVRLIDANAYPCQNCEVSYCYKNCKKFDEWFNKTVDAVEVVRCKDCGWWNENDSIFCSATKECRCGYWKGLFDYCKPNDFCSYGERKDDGK